MKTTWIIEPHEPLIFRDGRPFGMNPGTRIPSLPFPFPSTIAGSVRGRAGMNNPEGLFLLKDDNGLDQLKKIKVRGPLLVQLHIDPQREVNPTWLVPVPSDFLLIKEEKQDPTEKAETLLKRLVPLKADYLTDLSTVAPQELLLVGMSPHIWGKPLTNDVHYWNWGCFKRWLIDPDLLSGKPPEEAFQQHYEPQREQRVHISRDAKAHRAIEGQLFETAGLEFTVGGKESERLVNAKRLALAIEVENTTTYQLSEGQGTLGSERRVVTWRRSTTSLPDCPKEIKQAIVSDKACRIILLTPAYFKQGCIPEQLLKASNDVQAELKALTVGRPQVVSGWDMEKNEPKETQRLAPAGTVFFLTLKGKDNDIQKWVKNTWMRCISDDQQWCNDGFGLAVLGTWDSHPSELESDKHA